VRLPGAIGRAILMCVMLHRRSIGLPRPFALRCPPLAARLTTKASGCFEWLGCACLPRAYSAPIEASETHTQSGLPALPARLLAMVDGRCDARSPPSSPPVACTANVSSSGEQLRTLRLDPAGASLTGGPPSVSFRSAGLTSSPSTSSRLSTSARRNRPRCRRPHD
jgi:hypothetical protein